VWEIRRADGRSVGGQRAKGQGLRAKG
jgi:hypothetical protein